MVNLHTIPQNEGRGSDDLLPRWRSRCGDAKIQNTGVLKADWRFDQIWEPTTRESLGPLAPWLKIAKLAGWIVDVVEFPQKCQGEFDVQYQSHQKKAPSIGYLLKPSKTMESHESFEETNWRFPEIGLPPVIIHFRLGFSMKSTNHEMGYPYDYGNLQFGKSQFFQSIVQRLCLIVPLGSQAKLQSHSHTWQGLAAKRGRTCHPGTFNSCFK